MEPLEPLDELKIILMEKAIPYFDDETLAYYLNKNGGNVGLTAYNCLLLKAEDTTLSASGLSIQDTSKYFRRLATLYAPNNSGVLKGGF